MDWPSCSDSSCALSQPFSFAPCSYCDFYCDDGVWSSNLNETSASSSCPGYVTAIAVCPCFCCDVVSLLSVTWTSFVPWRTFGLCVCVAHLHGLQRLCLGLRARLIFCVIWTTSESLSFVPVLRRSCLFQENSATKRVSTMAFGRRYEIIFFFFIKKVIK